MSVSVLIDSNVLADWLTQNAPDGWWTVDGEDDLVQTLNLPCSGRDLAEALRRHGGRLRLIPPKGRPSPNVDRLEEFAETDEGGRIFQVSWDDRDKKTWLLAEDTLAAG